MFWAVTAIASAEGKFYTYVGRLSEDSVLLAWGTAGGGGNTIGRDSRSHGNATVTVGARRATTQKNWIEVDGLAPDTKYPYEVAVDGRTVGKGQVRTWPREARKLTFLVIGDYGNGTREQARLAEVMTREVAERGASPSPVRFVITTGDNVYGSGLFGLSHTGDDDGDWAKKFFEPYGRVIAEIPFYPTVGNHDGNESERRGDLGVYLDNFFFPGGEKSRFYRFAFANYVEFFALDSSDNSEQGGTRPLYLPDGEQSQWLGRAMAERSAAPWRIAYFHHPPFTAGPRHPPSRGTLGHWMELFQKYGVQAVFNGHEHNLQFSEVNERTAGIQYVISGSGGQRRGGSVRREMEAANIAGWSAQRQFLVVEMDGDTMWITPKSFEPMRVVNAKGAPVKLPVVVKRR